MEELGELNKRVMQGFTKGPKNRDTKMRRERDIRAVGAGAKEIEVLKRERLKVQRGEIIGILEKRVPEGVE